MGSRGARKTCERFAGILIDHEGSALSRALAHHHGDVVDYLLGQGARFGYLDALDMGDAALFGELLDEEIRHRIDERKAGFRGDNPAIER